METSFEGAACEKSVGLSMYGDPIETVEYNCLKTAKIHSL